MAWTTPRTWVTGEIVTAAYMNTDVRDNMNALSVHEHTGSPGDGAAIILGEFTNNRRFSRNLLFNKFTAGADPNWEHHQLLAGVGGGSVSEFGLWDATNKWIYRELKQVSTSAESGLLVYWKSLALSTQLLPTVVIPLAIDTLAESIVRLGLFVPDAAQDAEPDYGIFFRYKASLSANWICVHRNNNVESTFDSGVAAVATTPKEFKIVMTATGTTTFYIDGVLVGTVSTNAPPTTQVLYAGVAITTTGSGGATNRIARVAWIGVNARLKSS